MGGLIFFLLLAYPIMGLVHVISALIRFCFGANRYPGYKSKLGTYLALVALYFLQLYLFTEVLDIRFGSDFWEEMLMVYVFVVPWSLAAYFWMTIYHKPAKNPEKAYVEEDLV